MSFYFLLYIHFETFLYHLSNIVGLNVKSLFEKLHDNKVYLLMILKYLNYLKLGFKKPDCLFTVGSG